MGYTESLGFHSLRLKITEHYKKKYGLNIDASNVAVTAGASASILMAMTALFETGDHIAISSPGYPCYRNIIRALSLKEFIVETKIEDNFQLNQKNIEELPAKVKGLIISSPSNPTGSIIDNKTLKKIVAACKKRNITLISDEIYHGITFSKFKANSVLNYDKNGIVINSFSKYFLMTGWRLGWMIASKNTIDAISKLAMNLYLCPSAISQYAAMEVFKHYPYFDKVTKDYYTNRDIVLRELKKLGIKNYTVPYGAFYTYIDVSKFTSDSFKFCNNMLKDIQVTAAPGIDFDQQLGNKFIRISFAGEKKDLQEAFKRINKWI